MPRRKSGAARATADAPPSGRLPGPLAGCDAEAMAEALVAYHAQFHDLFARREQREWSAFYLRGQLAALERKTVEPMVLTLRGADRAAVRAVQQFLGEGAWDDGPILARREALVAEDLGAPDGVLIVDGSGFPKQGTHSVGVARRYCGHVGKIANGQHGVFLAYARASTTKRPGCRSGCSSSRLPRRPARARPLRLPSPAPLPDGDHCARGLALPPVRPELP